MQKNLFVKQFNDAEPSINKEHIQKIIKQSIDFNLPDGNLRGHRNLIIVMEELAELEKEISKELRDKGDIINILEELADVQLGIYYIQEICKIKDEELNKAMNVKMNRVEEILIENNRYI